MGISRNQENGQLPGSENDIVILVDFNTNRFDNNREKFWLDFETNYWDVLADKRNEYSATRLSGNPLKPRNSLIDYIVFSADEYGLSGREVRQKTTLVHTEVAEHNFDLVPQTMQRSSPCIGYGAFN